MDSFINIHLNAVIQIHGISCKNVEVISSLKVTRAVTIQKGHFLLA